MTEPAVAVEESAVTLAVRPERSAHNLTLLKPLAAPSVLIAAQRETVAFVKEVLSEGTDYGKIPGAGTKATLLKPGSEKVLIGFGCIAVIEVVESIEDHLIEVPWSKRSKRWNNRFKGDKSFEWDEVRGTAFGMYVYTVRVKVIHRDSGIQVGEGMGVCSSLESKYCDRPRETQNTILKMAIKRAQVDATLRTFGLSDEFTQDVEDLPRDGTAEVVEVEQVTPPTEVDFKNFGVLKARPYWTQEERDEFDIEADTARENALQYRALIARMMEEGKARKATAKPAPSAVSGGGIASVPGNAAWEAAKAGLPRRAELKDAEGDE